MSDHLERRLGALAEAVRLARGGSPVVVNVLLGRSEFRKGSLSM